MDFYRFKNCIIANISIQEFLAPRKISVLVFVFLERLRSLPLVGFSLRSAREIIEKNLDPDPYILCRSWKSKSEPSWTKAPVNKFDFLRILTTFCEDHASFQFRLNDLECSSPLEISYSNAFYLSISSEELFKVENSVPIVLLNEEQTVIWLTDKKIRPAAEVEKLDVCATSFPPICGWCCEKIIDTALLPCGHAPCCADCKKKFLEKKTADALTAEERVSSDWHYNIKCPICRVKTTQIRTIKFPSKHCLLCGCSRLDALAGGNAGCGCVIGCYPKAVALRQRGGTCPSCHSELDEIIQVYIQSDESLF